MATGLVARCLHVPHSCPLHLSVLESVCKRCQHSSAACRNSRLQHTYAANDTHTALLVTSRCSHCWNGAPRRPLQQSNITSGLGFVPLNLPSHEGFPTWWDMAVSLERRRASTAPAGMCGPHGMQQSPMGHVNKAKKRTQLASMHTTAHMLPAERVRLTTLSNTTARKQATHDMHPQGATTTLKKQRTASGHKCMHTSTGNMVAETSSWLQCYTSHTSRRPMRLQRVPQAPHSLLLPCCALQPWQP